MSDIRLDQLQTFIKVIELGSFSKAAEHLGLTQPAISIQMIQLEKALGVLLMERTRRPATPTAAGAELLGLAKEIDAKISNIRDSMTRY